MGQLNCGKIAVVRNSIFGHKYYVMKFFAQFSFWLPATSSYELPDPKFNVYLIHIVGLKQFHLPHASKLSEITSFSSFSIGCDNSIL